jgi:hypothetical protein
MRLADDTRAEQLDKYRRVARDIELRALANLPVRDRAGARPHFKRCLDRALSDLASLLSQRRTWSRSKTSGKKRTAETTNAPRKYPARFEATVRVESDGWLVVGWPRIEGVTGFRLVLKRGTRIVSQRACSGSRIQARVEHVPGADRISGLP